MTLVWDYQKDFIDKEKRNRFREEVVHQHDFNSGFSCIVKVDPEKLSPRKLLYYMEDLNFEELDFSKSKLPSLYKLKLYILNEMRFHFKLKGISCFLLWKWKRKKKVVTKFSDPEEECIKAFEQHRELYFPNIILEKSPNKNPGQLKRIKMFRKISKVNPKDFKNVQFLKETKISFDGGWYNSVTDTLYISKEDYQKKEVLIREYLKKSRYPKIDFEFPEEIYYSVFEERKFGRLENGVYYYCYNLPYDYYKKHLLHFKELVFDSKSKKWLSGSKSRHSVEQLIKNISEDGFKNPLCFVLTKNAQLVPLGCHTRIMVACYLHLPTIPGVILTIPTIDPKGDINCKDIARKILAPQILIN